MKTPVSAVAEGMRWMYTPFPSKIKCLKKSNDEVFFNLTHATKLTNYQLTN